MSISNQLMPLSNFNPINDSVSVKPFNMEQFNIEPLNMDQLNVKSFNMINKPTYPIDTMDLFIKQPSTNVGYKMWPNFMWSFDNKDYMIQMLMIIIFILLLIVIILLVKKNGWSTSGFLTNSYTYPNKTLDQFRISKKTSSYKPINKLILDKPINKLMSDKPINKLISNKPFNKLMLNKPINKLILNEPQIKNTSNRLLIKNLSTKSQNNENSVKLLEYNKEKTSNQSIRSNKST